MELIDGSEVWKCMLCVTVRHRERGSVDVSEEVSGEVELSGQRYGALLIGTEAFLQ